MLQADDVEPFPHSAAQRFQRGHEGTGQPIAPAPRVTRLNRHPGKPGKTIADTDGRGMA